MKPLALGVRYPDGAPLFAEVYEADLIDRITGITADAKRVAVAPWVFEREPQKQPRLDKPTEAGWTYVVADGDPDRDAIVAALGRLGEHRGMAKPGEPLHFPAGADRGDWIDHVYKGLGDNRPRYLLLAGDPTKLPFPLQVDLAAAGAIVGRICFSGDDRLDSYRAYVDKVIRLEAGKPIPTATATVVATDGGPSDATTYSSQFLAPPLVDVLKTAKLKVTKLAGPGAAREDVKRALRAGRPAVLFTATHGAGVTAEAGGGGTTYDPRAINGAWGCAPPVGASRLPYDWDWLAAADLPEGAVAPGGVVIQFACFGYGTIDHSSFAAWLGNTNVVEAPEPFVAAIPQRLLANPDGPIAYVGHVDVCLAYGFMQPGVDVPGHVPPRAQPFLTLVGKAVADLTPVGFALRDLHERAAAIGSEIASTFDGLQQANLELADLNDADRAKLVDKVIRRNDAMHFLVFGDPAVRVRIDDA